MGSGLHYFSTGQHEDLIRVFYNRQCVRNHHNGLVFLQKTYNCLFYSEFIFNVQRGGCLIKKQNRAVFQYSPGNRKPLPFTAGKQISIFTDRSIIALFHFADKRVTVRFLARRFNFFIGGGRFCMAYIFPNCIIKQEGVLIHHGDSIQHIFRIDISDRLSSDGNFSAFRLIILRNQIQDC